MALLRICRAWRCPYAGYLIRMVDMPAHLKSSLLGCSLTLPIQGGTLALGTWQGIYLCEHRNQGGSRRLLVTLQGE